MFRREEEENGYHNKIITSVFLVLDEVGLYTIAGPQKAICIGAGEGGDEILWQNWLILVISFLSLLINMICLIENTFLSLRI